MVKVLRDKFGRVVCRLEESRCTLCITNEIFYINNIKSCCISDGMLYITDLIGTLHTFFVGTWEVESLEMFADWIQSGYEKVG